MKFAPELFPMGTYPGQKSPGLYIDGTLAKNLDVIAEAMKKDIFPVIVLSGDNQSGTGKSTMMSQIGVYLTYKINQFYKLNNTFTADNISFKIDDLLKKAPEFAKNQPFSVLAQDEPDELNEHQMKKKSFELRSAFRKLRQLNLIFLITSHSYFELPKFYALNRTQALLNVVFKGKFDRGYFFFYGPKAKKLLYFKGKKEWNYQAHPDDFSGRFAPCYAFFPNCKQETEKYRKRKYRDMVDELEGKNRPKELTERQITIKIFKQLRQNLDGISVEKLGQAFGITKSTAFRWLAEDINSEKGEGEGISLIEPTNINYLIKKDNVVDEEEEENKQC
jgi:ribosomal protein S24E